MLKSPPTKSTLCCCMYPCSCRRRSVEASRFLATTLWMCTEQNVTVGVPESEGRRSRPRTMSRTIPHVPLLVESSLKAKTIVGLEGVLVEQDGEVRDASVRNELIGDVGDVIGGFLKDNHMKPSASRCHDIGGVPPRWAWVPLKNQGPRLWKRSTSRTRVCTDGTVGSRQGGACTPFASS